MGRKISRAQRKALGRVMHYTAVMLENAAFNIQLTKGPLSEDFVNALRDDERELHEKLRQRLLSDGKMLHKFGIKLEGFGPQP